MNSLVTIVAGSRKILDSKLVYGILDKLPWQIEVLFSGRATGVDTISYLWGLENLGPQKLRSFIPNWSLGKKAGPLRNLEMATQAQALVAIWDGESRGTKDMINKAIEHNLIVLIYNQKFPEINPKVSHENINSSNMLRLLGN